MHIKGKFPTKTVEQRGTYIEQMIIQIIDFSHSQPNDFYVSNMQYTYSILLHNRRVKHA